MTELASIPESYSGTPAIGGGTIAQVVGSFGGGGAERLAYNLGLALRRRGIPCVGIAVRRPGSYADQTHLPVLDLGCEAGGWRMVRGMWRFRRLVRQHDIRLLHIHGAATVCLCVVALLGLRRRPRLFFTWHNSEAVVTETGWRRALMLWSLRRCDRLFGASASIAQRLQAAVGSSMDVRVFRNGVPEIPDPQTSRNGVPVVLWMARIVPAKDPMVLVRAAARLRDAGLRFRIILAGNAPENLGWYRDKLCQLLGELRLTEMVTLPGWVDDTRELLASSHIGVQTSHAEGLSMTLLEKMMAGLAIVATDVGDTAAAVEHGKTGLLVPPENEDALVTALTKLISDADLRAKLGRAAREQALENFSIGAMAGTASRFYAVPTVDRERRGHSVLDP